LYVNDIDEIFRHLSILLIEKKRASQSILYITNAKRKPTTQHLPTFPGCLFPKTVVTLTNIISYVKEISCIISFSKRENVHLRANQIDGIIGLSCSESSRLTVSPETNHGSTVIL